MMAPLEATGRASDGWLARLAGVWVERWLAHGGSLTVDPHHERVGAGMAMAGRLWRSPNPWGQRLWHDGWKVGRWRELSEMAGYIPGLRGAIIDHVARNGIRSVDGSTVMTRSAEEMGVV